MVEVAAKQARPEGVLVSRDDGRVVVGVAVGEWVKGGQEVVDYAADGPHIDFIGVGGSVLVELLGGGPVCCAKAGVVAD